jgi:hypothetical protein
MNRQTELTLGWLEKHPDVVEVLRKHVAAGGDLRDHATSYIFPIDPPRNVYDMFIFAALDGVDWGRVRDAIIPPGDGQRDGP